MSEKEEEPSAAAPRPVQLRSLTVLPGEQLEPDCEYPVGTLVIPPVVVSEQEISSVAIILLCEVSGRLVVAVPQGAWHRQTNRRLLPPGVLISPVAVDLLFGDRLAQSPAEPHSN